MFLLLQCVASHPDTRMLLINGNVMLILIHLNYSEFRFNHVLYKSQRSFNGDKIRVVLK
jgi:hypothetical protein